MSKPTRKGFVLTYAPCNHPLLNGNEPASDTRKTELGDENGPARSIRREGLSDIDR